MALTLNENELANILAEVERDLAGALVKAEESVSPEASASPEGSPEASASPEGSPEASASPEGSPEALAPEAPEAPAPGSEVAPGAEAGGDLASKLSALPDDQLMQLYQMAKQVVFSRMQAKSPGPSAAPMAPPPGPSAGPMAPPGPSAGPSPAFKAEAMPKNPANGSLKMGKSENTDEKKIEELSGQVQVLAQGLNKALSLIAGQPVRKAVTSIQHVPKPGDVDLSKDISSLSKAEVTSRLTEKTRDPSMSKKDRQLVNGFYDGRFDVSKIAHLLQ